MLASSHDFGGIDQRGTSAAAPTLPSSTATFEAYQPHPTDAQPYAAFGADWNAPPYSPPPPNMAWDVPQWTSMDYFHRVAQRPETYHYTPAPTQPIFTHAQTPLQRPREILASMDSYAFDSSMYGQHSQTHTIPNVSQSASYPEERYPRPQ